MNIIFSADILKLFNSEMHGPVPKAAIEQLMEWGVIPPEGVLKCPNGHFFSLVEAATLDGWVWR